MQNLLAAAKVRHEQNMGSTAFSEECTSNPSKGDPVAIGTGAIMDDISSFVEAIHSKNLILKKLAKRQQQRIDELCKENEELRDAKEQKDAKIDEITAQAAALASKLQESSSRGLAKSLTPASKPCLVNSSEIELNINTVGKRAQPENLPGKAAQKSLTGRGKGCEEQGRSGLNLKVILVASAKLGLVQAKQMLRKVSRRLDLVSATRNAYMLSRPVIEGAVMALLMNDSEGQYICGKGR